MPALIQNNLSTPDWVYNPILDTHLFSIPGTPITVTTLIIFVITIIATFIFSWLIRRPFTRWFLAKRFQDDFIQVNDRFVRVEKLGIRATIARTLGDDERIQLLTEQGRQI